MFGVLNLNKPAGITSRDVVNRVQKLIRPDKCGHAGTLDPMATGVLLVCVGPATRLVSLLQQMPKTYESCFRLGVRSDTDDITGDVTHLQEIEAPPSVAALEAALLAQTGTIQQVPPAFSAVHVNGRRAYRMARAGEKPKLAARSVVVHSIELLKYQWPDVEVRITCGSGTYIRSIARDLGDTLNCGGLMTELIRTSIGDFGIESASAAEFEDVEVINDRLISPIRIVSQLPQYCCTRTQAQDTLTGKLIWPESGRWQRPTAAEDLHAAPVALLSESASQLLALAEWREQDGRNALQPRSVFAKRPAV